jgi:hypothetical protein
VLRKTIGLKEENKKEVTGDWRKLHSKNLRNFYSSSNIIVVVLFVCFPGVTTHCGCIFHSQVAGFSLLVFEVS